MPRPVKEGLEYFPVDIDIFDDPKLLFVSEKYGEMGELIALKLLSWIYRSGYYIEWNDDMAVIFSSRAFRSIKSDFVKDVVNELVERGFFDKKKFVDYGILTSRGIQKRWQLIITNAKRKAKINSLFALVNSEETTAREGKSPITSEETTAKAEETTQSKVKESKEKKSKEEKEKEKEESPPKRTPENLEEVKEFLETITGNPEDSDLIAERFFNYYEAQGWVTKNGVPIVNWKASLRQWVFREGRSEKNENRNGGKTDFNSRLKHRVDLTKLEQRAKELQEKFG